MNKLINSNKLGARCSIPRRGVLVTWSFYPISIFLGQGNPDNASLIPRRCSAIYSGQVNSAMIRMWEKLFWGITPELQFFLSLIPHQPWQSHLFIVSPLPTHTPSRLLLYCLLFQMCTVTTSQSPLSFTFDVHQVTYRTFQAQKIIIPSLYNIAPGDSCLGKCLWPVFKR